MSVWSPRQYGWEVCYFVTVEGIPVVWSEKKLQLTLPSGVQLDASLVIDRSSEVGQTVDRDKGVGVGLPLTVQLLDTNMTRQVFKKWSWQGDLAQDLLWADPTIKLVDISGLPAGTEMVWVGSECLTFTGTGGTSGSELTGVAHGKFWSQASNHFAGSVGGIVTTAPRWFHGRELRLFALPVDPFGVVPGSALFDFAEEVWRGFVDDGPVRAGGQWELVCQSIDRRLTLPLVRPFTGTIADAEPRFDVNRQETITFQMRGWETQADYTEYLKNHAYNSPWFFTFDVMPFLDVPDGVLLTAQDQIDLICSAFKDALSATSNDGTDGTSWVTADDAIDSLLFKPATQAEYVQYKSDPQWEIGYHLWQLALKPVTTTNVQMEMVKVVIMTGMYLSQNGGAAIYQTPSYKTPLFLGIASGGNICKSATDLATWLTYKDKGVDGLCVQLDDMSDSVPESGTLKVTGSQGDVSISYKKVLVNTQTGVAFFYQLAKKFQSSDLVVMIGQTVEISFAWNGTFSDAICTLLESSGCGNRGSFDTLPYGSGYGLSNDGSNSAVDEESVLLASGGPLADLPCSISGNGASFEEVFGGVLALGQRALVARQDNLSGSVRVRLGLVDTEGGGSDYCCIIEDKHLAVGDGDPVQSVRGQKPPNVVSVTLNQGQGDKIVVHDESAVLQQGANEVEWKLPVEIKDAALLSKISSWVNARFLQAQIEQIVELRVVPWAIEAAGSSPPRSATIGDLVYLNTKHFAVWQWSTGTPGYSGLGRILGLKRRLVDGLVTLTLLIDGAVTASGICPSAQVVGFPTPPFVSWVELPAIYFEHLRRALLLSPDSVLPKLRLYKPGYGSEGSGVWIEYNTVTMVSGVARLSISGHSGSLAFDNDTWLTLPELGQCNVYQSGFSHTDDGAFWG